jgi:hypothetical protein
MADRGLATAIGPVETITSGYHVAVCVPVPSPVIAKTAPPGDAANLNVSAVASRMK